jgi:hypothetical protein
MGVRVIAKGVDAEQYATEYAAPIRRGLEAIFFLNTSLEKSARNYVAGKPQGSIVGSPVANPNYLATKGRVNYVQTQLAETADMTIFVLARTSADGSVIAERPMLFGNYQTLNADGGAAFGVCMYLTSPTRFNAGAGFGADAAANELRLAGLTKADIANKWNLYGMVVSSAGLTLRDFTTNQTSTAPGVALPRRLASGKIRIGSGVTAFDGSADMAVFQAHSVALTETEIQTTVADLRAYAARRGIVV